MACCDNSLNFCAGRAQCTGQNYGQLNCLIKRILLGPIWSFPIKHFWILYPRQFYVTGYPPISPERFSLCSFLFMSVLLQGLDLTMMWRGRSIIAILLPQVIQEELSGEDCQQSITPSTVIFFCTTTSSVCTFQKTSFCLQLKLYFCFSFLTSLLCVSHCV